MVEVVPFWVFSPNIKFDFELLDPVILNSRTENSAEYIIRIYKIFYTEKLKWTSYELSLKVLLTVWDNTMKIFNLFKVIKIYRLYSKDISVFHLE